MNPSAFFRLAVTMALTVAAASAQATTVDLSSSVSNGGSGGPSYQTFTTDFSLPAGFSNPVLNITELDCDDRCVVELNGTVIDSSGIFGPGAGSFVFTSGGPNDPYTFALGNGATNLDVTSGFQVGTNELLLILNDTGQGISGNLTNGPNGPAGPTGFNITAMLTYDAPGGVPEPATWALMLLGFGAIGVAIRHRRPRNLSIA